MERQISFHVDIDSPRTLLRFWGCEHESYRDKELDLFFDRAVARALDLFKECAVPVTFFCVGRDLEESRAAREGIARAHQMGHEIANHTYSHPFGMTQLEKRKISDELERCSDLLQKITGERPIGFRAPSYEINNDVLNLLEEHSFLYDCSAFWSSLNALVKVYHARLSKKGKLQGFGSGTSRIPRNPYYPSRSDWMSPGPARSILEIPMPRTRVFNLPFYNNFHLSAGEMYRRFSVATYSGNYVVFLMHLIEFVDLNDSVPKSLAVHPNVKIPHDLKLKATKDSILRLKKRYQVVRTGDYVKGYRPAA